MDKLETIAEESEGVPGLYNVCFDGNFSVPITSSVLDTQEIGSNFNLSNPQDVIIADISYSTPTLLNTSFENATHTLTSKESEEINLRSLLTKWNLASLTDHFISQNVFVGILKIMKRHHIERLLRNFDMGTQILFEHNLEQWRESLGLPLGYSSSEVYSSRNLYSSPSSPSVSSSGRLTPTRYSTPYARPTSPENNTSSSIQLATILNQSSRGSILIEYYNKFSKFQDDQRSLLVTLIAQYFQEKGVKMTLAASHKIEREIIERFPAEKLVR